VDAAGRVLLFTGDGKGKTTAALGLALRAAGHDLHVLIVQFVKNNPKTGELRALQYLPSVELRQTGLGFVPPPSDPSFPGHRRAAEEGLELVCEALVCKRYDLVILDEICVALSLGLLRESAVLDVVGHRAAGVHVVLTGRGATPALLELADTVTEMSAVKHPYEAGKAATKGIEL